MQCERFVTKTRMYFWKGEAGVNSCACIYNFLFFLFCHADSARFDASQYEFFGRNVLQEVELGGLEDNEDNGPAFGPADDEYHLFDKEEVIFFYMFT